MEPQIRYTRTADDVSIAYYDVGQGAPLVVLPTIPWSNIEAEFKLSEVAFWHRLASEHRFIHYDVRGAGLSQRGPVDFSLRALQLDLDAVVSRLGLDRVSLYAEGNAAKIALAYAAASPERIDRIILWSGCARGSDLWGLPRWRAVGSLLEQSDWEFYTETVAQVIFGFAAGEQAREYAAYMRNCVNKDEATAYIAADGQEEVTPLLPSVTARTLVLHPSNAPLMAPLDWGRALASSIPHAQLKLFETDVLWSDEIEDWLVASINEFLDAGRIPDAPAAPSAAIGMPGGAFQMILFTDMESSTAQTQRLGDALAQQLVRTHNTLVRDALRVHGGREIKHTGDGIMAAFAVPSAGVACAIDIQREVARLNEAEAGTASRLKIGLNAGEPVAEEDDLFGTAVQLARRICDHASPGQILVPEGVRHLVAGKNFLFADEGDTLLRGFEDAVRLYDVRWRE